MGSMETVVVAIDWKLGEIWCSADAIVNGSMYAIMMTKSVRSMRRFVIRMLCLLVCWSMQYAFVPMRCIELVKLQYWWPNLCIRPMNDWSSMTPERTM